MQKLNLKKALLISICVSLFVLLQACQTQSAQTEITTVPYDLDVVLDARTRIEAEMNKLFKKCVYKTPKGDRESRFTRFAGKLVEFDNLSWESFVEKRDHREANLNNIEFLGFVKIVPERKVPAAAEQQVSYREYDKSKKTWPEDFQTFDLSQASIVNIAKKQGQWKPLQSSYSAPVSSCQALTGKMSNLDEEDLNAIVNSIAEIGNEKNEGKKTEPSIDAQPLEEEASLDCKGLSSEQLSARAIKLAKGYVAQLISKCGGYYYMTGERGMAYEVSANASPQESFVFEAEGFDNDTPRTVTVYFKDREGTVYYGGGQAKSGRFTRDVGPNGIGRLSIHCNSSEIISDLKPITCDEISKLVKQNDAPMLTSLNGSWKLLLREQSPHHNFPLKAVLKADATSITLEVETLVLSEEKLKINSTNDGILLNTSSGVFLSGSSSNLKNLPSSQILLKNNGQKAWERTHDYGSWEALKLKSRSSSVKTSEGTDPKQIEGKWVFSKHLQELSVIDKMYDYYDVNPVLEIKDGTAVLRTPIKMLVKQDMALITTKEGLLLKCNEAYVQGVRIPNYTSYELRVKQLRDNSPLFLLRHPVYFKNWIYPRTD